MSPLILFAIGILFLVVEVLTMTFALLWIGIGFLFVSLGNYFYPIDNVYVQVAVAMGIGFALMLLLRKKVQDWFTGKRTLQDEFLQMESGVGTVVEGAIKFKGTLWQAEFKDSQSFELITGDKVMVVAFNGNKVVIKAVT